MPREPSTPGDDSTSTATGARDLEGRVEDRELVHGKTIAVLGSALVLLMTFQSWLLWRAELRDENRQTTINGLVRQVNSDADFLATVRQLIILGPNGDAAQREALLDQLRQQQAARDAVQKTSPTTTTTTTVRKGAAPMTPTTQRQSAQPSSPPTTSPSSTSPGSPPTTRAPPPPAPIITVPPVTLPCVPINKSC